MRFDYTNQAWTQDGVYVDCRHRVSCDCYGRAHAGEPVSAEIIAEMDERERSVIESNNGVYYTDEPIDYTERDRDAAASERIANIEDEY